MRTAFTIALLKLLLALNGADLYAQFAITMPVDRSVFQRVNNKATIQIGGFTDVFIEQLQIKLEVINGGISIDWTTINTNILPGDFRCQIPDIEAGWYQVETRGLSNGSIVAFDEVGKVGVGEVFIIAGQSNAQGGRPPHPEFSTNVFYGADDDRVNCINYSTNNPAINYPFPSISKVQPETDVAPKGEASWCWALLGDKIVEEWNVPVLFFNAAVGATTMSTWSQSVNSNSEPYIYLKKSLEYYAKIFGVRAILWHQGESDIFNFDVNMPQSCNDYQSNLTTIINRSRSDLGANVSWVISKVSRLADWTSSGLIQCQESFPTIPDINAFAGPYTDFIQPGSAYRDGGVHFRGTGFIELADVWFNSINQPNFINNSTPVAATNNLKVVNNEYVFGNSLAPCAGLNQTIASGNWNDPSIWSCGAVPTSLNEIVINTEHTILISEATVFIKNLVLNGSLIFENGGNLFQVDY
ncbi:MAG: sialate O-acetylesterase [Bacteroidota bacterium]